MARDEVEESGSVECVDIHSRLSRCSPEDAEWCGNPGSMQRADVCGISLLHAARHVHTLENESRRNPLFPEADFR